MRAPSLLPLPAIILLSAHLPLSAQQEAEPSGKHTLKLIWEPAKVYTLETDTETTTELTAIGQPSDQRLFLKQTTSIVVTPGPAGDEKEALVTFESMLGEMEFQDQRLLFDSSRPEESHPLLRGILGSSTGKSFTLVYKSDDTFMEVRHANPTSTSAEPTPELLSIAEAQELAALFRRSLEMGLPRTPVSVGDRWTADESMAFPKAGKMKVQLKSKFEEVVDRESRPHAKISFTGQIQSDLGDATAEDSAPAVGSGSVVIGKDSNLSGQVFFDLERNAVSVAVFLANLTLEINGKRLPVRQKVTTRLINIDDLATSIPSAVPAK